MLGMTWGDISPWIFYDMGLPLLLVAAAAYLLGCSNGAVIVSKYILRDDVRTHGSGNAGLTNFYRTYGAKYALGVILFDMGKTVIACLIGGAAFDYLAGDWMLGVLLGGLGCELGHMFPCMFGFRGGKGILSGWFIAWTIDWRIGLLIGVVFFVTYLITKYVSLGSVLASITFAVGFVVFQHDHVYVMAGGIFMGALCVFMHRANILRLIHGEERKTNLFGKGSKS